MLGIKDQPEISIVIPIYNEEGNVRPLIESIGASLKNHSFEVIAVDDGSTDNTPIELKSLEEEFSFLKILKLKRNFGQTAGMAAGIDHAKGNIIIPMDGDGQNDPSDIPTLVAKFKEGYEVVSGWRKDRQDKLISRKLPSWIANGIISHVTGVHLHDYGCTLKAYKRTTIQNIQLSGEMHRFLPAWCVWQGGKVAEIPVNHHPRRLGKSKYGMMRIFKVLIDLMTLKFFSGYLAKPNYLFSGTAFVMFLGMFLTAAFAIFDKFGPDLFPVFRIPLLLASLFFGIIAVFLLLMGLLSELLVRLYFQVRQQKPYRLADE